MAHQYRCSYKQSKKYTQCSFCDSDGKMVTVLNHNPSPGTNKTGIKCPCVNRAIYLDYEGVTNENIPQEYLPELNKGLNKEKLENE